MSLQARPARSRTRYSSQARRAHLLDVAHEVCQTHGVAGVTIERIAEQAGVSRTLVYQHFTSSTDVLLHVLQREREWLQHEITKGLSSARTFEEKVRAVTGPFLFARRDRGATILHAFLAESSADVVATTAHDWLERWGRFWVDEAVTEFGIDPDTARTLVDMFRGAFFATQRIMWHDAEADPERLQDLLVTIVVTSLCAMTKEE